MTPYTHQWDTPVPGQQKRRLRITAACVLGWMTSGVTGADGPPKDTVYLEQNVADSNSRRIEQAQELDRYIKRVQQDETALHGLLQPDYASPEAYTRSVEPYRRAFFQSISYPPPGERPTASARFELMGEDGIAHYYRATIPVLPGVHAEGIYIVPKRTTGRVPLIIAQHGGAGSPELALFHGGSNYHDMVRGAVKRGYAVFAPQLLFSSPGLAKETRRETDRRLRLIGTTITAVEVAKIVRSLDVLLQRPEVDASRVGMVGLSYGGYYTLMTAAVDTRIKVAVSSGYYGVQEGRYAINELSIPTDLEFPARFTLFRDSDLVALICPRPLLLQAGNKDEVHHADAGRRLAPRSAGYYSRLGLAERFQHVLFEGGHEFHDASAWAFMQKHL